jgi:hypothetical protein
MDLDHYLDEKCTTSNCTALPVVPRIAKKDSERIEFCDSHQPTVVWECTCQWKKMVLYKPPEA